MTSNKEMRFVAALVLICWAACLGPAWAADPNGINNGPAASQVQSEANNLISGRVSHQTDLFSGSFGYSVSIEGAPARHGTEPPLALVYSSSGENGWCGVGWNLDVGYIERNTKDGFPMKYNADTLAKPLMQYDDTKGFVFNLFGKSAKLLQVSPPNGNEYRAEVDTDFIRCIFDTTNNRWDVYDKSGNVYRFAYYPTGTGANPRQINPSWTGATHTRTFRWALDEIITATGDRTTITYSSDGNTLYPNLISYNGHTSKNGYSFEFSPSHTIQFETEARTDKRFSYRSGFRVEQNRRLTNVVCKVGSLFVRHYHLKYGYSLSTGRSLMKEIKVYGSDNTTGLPSQTFTYQEQSGVTFASKVKWGGINAPGSVYRAPINSDGSATYADLVDIDGDGLPDRIRWDPSASPDRYAVQRNLGMQPNGEGLLDTDDYFGPTSFGVLPGSVTSEDNAEWSAMNAPRMRFLDVDGDGRPDRVMDDRNVYSTGFANLDVQKNTGVNFTERQAWPVNVQGQEFFKAIENQSWVKMVDINGDGIQDRVMLTNGYPAKHMIVQLGTGSGFTSSKSFGPYDSQGGSITFAWAGVDGGNQTRYIRMIDINGDGLPDRVMLPRKSDGTALRDATLNKFVVEFNNGYGFETQQDWPNVNPQVVTIGITTYTWYCDIYNMPHVGLFDINGDGLPDRVMPKLLDSTHTTWYVQLNTGTGFSTTLLEVTGIYRDDRAVNIPGWYGIQGVHADGYADLVTTTLDINGDGLVDRVMADYDFYNYQTAGNGFNGFWVQTNSTPFPDLMTNVNNAIGGNIAVAYKPSTAWDNRQDPSDANSGKLLPFPVQTVVSVTENDGVNSPRTTAYAYEGGFYDGSRHEFAGFAKVTATDPSNRKQIYFFHQGGGQDRASSGEYLDVVAGVGNFAKKGMAYRIETYGNDTPTAVLYNVVVNQVDQTDLGNGRRFPFVKQTFNFDYPGPKATATKFVYDNTTGNLTKKVLYGEVTGWNLTSYTFTTDVVPADTQYHHISYAPISGNTYILDHPDTLKLTSDDAGTLANTLQETKYTYNGPYNFSSGTTYEVKTRICSGTYAVRTFNQYDSYGLPDITTDEVGVQTKVDLFDATYHIYPETTRQRIGVGDSVNDHFTYATYDARSGLLATSKDPMGIRVQNTYDKFFRLEETLKGTSPDANPSLWVKRASYNLGAISSGTAVSYAHVKVQDGTTDTSNGTESRTYVDGFGRPIQTVTEAEQSGYYRRISTAYDARGIGFLTTWPQKDTSGFIHLKPSGTLPATFTGFDPAGRVSRTHPRVQAVFNANGVYQSHTEHAGDGSTTSPLAAKTWSYVNGTDPWWIIFTDEDNKVRRYQLDAFGQTNKIEEVDGGSTYNTFLYYDLAGNLTQIKNHNNEQIYYGYDDVGNVVAMADPHLGQWTYERDKAGRIRRQTDGNRQADGNGQRVEFTYGASLSRLSEKRVYNRLGQLVSTTTYTYDSGDAGHTVYKGLLFQVSTVASGTPDRGSWEKNGYDTRGRLQKTTQHLNINNQNYVTTYDYSEADKIKTIGYPNNGPTINYAYHAGGSLNRVYRTGYDYYTATAANFDEFGHVLNFTYGNGKTTSRSYYTYSKRLQTISVPGILSKTYRYSPADDVTFISSTGIGDTTITYDNLHRVLTYSPGLSGSYAYDTVGNITTSYDYDSGTAHTYTYGTVARKQAVKTVTASGYNKKYLYDKCGNMIVRKGDTTGSQALDYDAENRLTRLSQSGATPMIVEFGYAADGTRLWKRKNQDQNKLQLWIGNIYEQKEQDGTRKTLFHVFAGGQRICTFEPGSKLAGGTDESLVSYYYHQDHLNSSSALSSWQGGTQPLEVNVFYPFGRTQTATPQAAFKVSNQFTGQVKDEETGLYYYGARYYDPELGRFIQADTIIPDLSNPQSYNRYAYVLNNPLKYNDPDGHQAAPVARPAQSTQIRGVSAIPLINAQIKQEMRLTGQNQYQIEFRWAQREAQITRNTRAHNREFLPNPPSLSGETAFRPLTPRPAAGAGQLELSFTREEIARATQPISVRGAAKTTPGVKYIGKMDDLQGIPRSQTLLDDLPNLGNPRANYYQNSSVLRKAVRDGYEIRDASAYRPNWSPDPTLLRPDRTVGQSFLGAERLILDNKGLIPGPNGAYVPR